MNRNLAIITEQKSDLSALLEKYFSGSVSFFSPKEILSHNLLQFEAIAVLGGTQEKPLVFNAICRAQIEECIQKGIRVFCEYVMSIGDIYCADPVSTRFSRMVCCSSFCDGITEGDLLDDQCNDFLSPYFSRSQETAWLIRGEMISSHSRTTVTAEMKQKIQNRALWLERKNLLIASFRMCNMVRARFAPYDGWNSVARHIISWVTQEKMDCFHLNRAYSVLANRELSFESRAREGLRHAMSWFSESGVLNENGTGGIQEGYGTEVYPDGIQKKACTVRTDCTGEASLAFFADYLLTDNLCSLETSDRLESFCFDQMQIKSGEFAGMLRWTEVAWGVCYQDDMARALLPSLLKMMYLNKTDRLADCSAALDFLQKTTGTDGLRPARTDNLFLTPKEMHRLSSTPGAFPSAHYNAYYHAALLLCGKLAHRDDFINTGVRGLESIMKQYPKTMREQSETEELCRLILPLSVLYYVTQKETHKQWLYRVAQDLQQMKHPSGAYIEWDSDYSAACSRKENAECSMLTQNGDPVVDLLYSLNWLPLGFFMAWHITQDEWFASLWQQISSFLLDVQIHSDNPHINGSWARGFDVDRMEVYGLPNDVGWGPWAIESGWTVAEIFSGIALGLCKQNIFLTQKD